MAFFITETDTEKLLAPIVRSLPMPDGSTRSFVGLRVLWDAVDFLIVCGRWTRIELVDLALRRMQAHDFSVTGLKPKGIAGVPVSLLEMRKLESHRVDPVSIAPIMTAGGSAALSLDQHFHNVIAELYSVAQDELSK